MKRTPLKRKTPLKSSGPIKPKKRVAKSAKWYRDKCDSFARDICKIRAQGICANCKRKLDRMEWAHRKSRRYLCIRYDPRNCDCLCWLCHTTHTCNPDEASRFVERIDPGAWDYLNERMRDPIKIHWPTMYEALKAELELVKQEFSEAA